MIDPAVVESYLGNTASLIARSGTSIDIDSRRRWWSG